MMISRTVEDRREREPASKTWESAIRPPRDSAARVDAAGADDEQGVAHLIRSIAHRLDRLEQRLAFREAAERSRSVRRARFLQTAAVLLVAAAAAVVVWKFTAAARPDPFLVPGHRATAADPFKVGDL